MCISLCQKNLSACAASWVGNHIEENFSMFSEMASTVILILTVCRKLNAVTLSLGWSILKNVLDTEDVSVKITVSWDVVLYNLVDRYQYFRVTCHLCLKGLTRIMYEPIGRRRIVWRLFDPLKNTFRGHSDWKKGENCIFFSPTYSALETGPLEGHRFFTLVSPDIQLVHW